MQGGRAGSGQRVTTTFALPSLLILNFGKIMLLAHYKARMEWKQAGSGFEWEKRAVKASTNNVSDSRSRNSWPGLPFCLIPIRTEQSSPVAGTGKASRSPEKLCHVSAGKPDKIHKCSVFRERGNETENLGGF